MTRSSRRANVAKVAVKATTIAMMSLGGLTAPQAAPQNIEADWQHFLNCADWLVNDPERHADNCWPNRVPSLLSTLAPSQSGTSVSNVPPVPAAPPPDDEYDYDYDYDYDDD
jgi:hypothetical protein